MADRRHVRPLRGSPQAAAWRTPGGLPRRPDGEGQHPRLRRAGARAAYKRWLTAAAGARLTDLSASQADEWLTRQRTAGRPALDLPAGRTAFTPGETAKLLGVSTGRGARRRETPPARGDRQGQGPALPAGDRRGPAGPPGTGHRRARPGTTTARTCGPSATGW